MKKYIFFSFAFMLMVSLTAHAQATFNTINYVDANNIRASILVHGDMFWNPPLQVASCEFPKGTGKQIDFAGAIWMSGYDASGALHVAAQTLRQTGNDYWPGPLDATDTNTYANAYAWAKIWKVSKTDVSTFLALTTHTTANTPADILTWPAKGNTFAQGNDHVALTITTDMAPFVDVNHNGIYEPLLGEYPAIKGDQSLWWTFSDNGPSHNQTNGKPLGVEVHAMAYAISRGTLMDDIIYFDYNIVNKSVNDYHDFRFAFWNDADLGFYFDNFIGFDSTWRMAIVYSINDDGGGGGHPVNSYGNRPAQFGMTFITLPGDEAGNDAPVGNFDYYNNDATIVGNPVVDTEYNNYMRGKLRNGSHFTNDFTTAGVGTKGYGSGPDCNYVFPGDPANTLAWSECASNNGPGDRRFVFSSNDFTLNAGGTQHILMAMVITDSAGGCPQTSFDSIRVVADTAWAEYQDEVATGVVNIQPQNVLNIYPNPAHNELIIGTTLQSTAVADIMVYNFLGQVMNVPVSKCSKGYVADISKLPPGIYNVLYRQDGNIKTSNFIKQ